MEERKKKRGRPPINQVENKRVKAASVEQNKIDAFTIARNLIEKNFSVNQACKSAGIPRATYIRWQETLNGPQQATPNAKGTIFSCEEEGFFLVY